MKKLVWKNFFIKLILGFFIYIYNSYSKRCPLMVSNAFVKNTISVLNMIF